MRYLSLCSGIEAASVAWAPMGWKAAAFAEIEAFPSAVLAHHYPDVPNLGDITKFKEWPDLGPVDIVCGGTPCQSFSVAGLRKGLADPRGNLSLTFLAIVDKYRPRYVVWENVPGVLSSDGGRDFAAFLGGLGQLGYGWAFRVLDAQFCRVDGFPRAVPQRRRRVFVVGYLGDWRRAAAVLSEPESVLGDTPPRREAGQGTAGHAQPGFAFDGQNIASSSLDAAGPTLDTGSAHSNRGLHIAHVDDAARCDTAGFAQRLDWETENFVATRDVAATLTRGAESAGKGGYAGRRQEDDDNLVAHSIAPAITGNPYGDHESREDLLVAHSLRGEGFDASEDGTGRGTPLVPIAIQERAISENPDAGPDGVGVREDGAAYTLEARQVPQAVAFTCSDQANGFAWERDVWQTLDAQVPSDTSNIQKGIRQGWAVRRLTPTECERLQGFPDSYTAIPYRGKPAADGPRYKALGNSWAVNVARWVGRRIEMVEQIAAELERERAA